MPHCSRFSPLTRRSPLNWRISSNTLPTQQENNNQDLYYTNLLQRCSTNNDRRLGAAVHAHLIRGRVLADSIYVQNHILNMYFKCRGDEPRLALNMFDQMPDRNVVTWSSAIAGLVHCNKPCAALELFDRMHREGVPPNEFTFVSALNASSLTEGCNLGQMIYAQVIRLGFESNVFLMNAFLMSLIRKGRLDDAGQVFEKWTDKDVVTWNSMLAGYLRFGCVEIWRFWCQMVMNGVRPNEFSFSSVLKGLGANLSFKCGLQVHAQLVKYGHGDDLCAANTLVDMYLKNRDLNGSFKAFNEMSEKDVVSWTQMAAGCLDCGQPVEALRVVYLMKLAGVRPNKFTLSTTFNACSTLASLEEGRKAHGFRIKLGKEVDECVDNALVDMYSKCGLVDSAWKVFQLMNERSNISWTTMIMGFAQSGFAREALEVFNKMISEKVEPNYITFICVLYACGQGGFLDEARGYFNSMSLDHGIEPGEDHYTCMVDLLGKAGCIAEAEALIHNMPFQPGLRVWQTLLVACQLHGDVDTAKRAAEQALALEKKNASTYVMLSNIFADTSNWDAVSRVRELMEEHEVTKIPASSWI